VHAGWRGTLAGIAEKTVRLFKDQNNIDAADLEVALGPSIGVCCYEVKDDVIGPLMKKWGRLTTPSIAVKDGKSFVNSAPSQSRLFSARPESRRNSFTRSAHARAARRRISTPTGARGAKPAANQCCRLVAGIKMGQRRKSLNSIVAMTLRRLRQGFPQQVDHSMTNSNETIPPMKQRG
jgi:hypothetical protein